MRVGSLTDLINLQESYLTFGECKYLFVGGHEDF